MEGCQVAFTREGRTGVAEWDNDRGDLRRGRPDGGTDRDRGNGWGGILVAGISGGVAIHAAMAVAGGLLAGIESLPPDIVPWIALGILGVVAFVAGVAVAAWKERVGIASAVVAGLSAAILLFLLRTFVLPGRPFNPLVFGWPGYLASAALASVGGLVGSRSDPGGTAPPLAVGARIGLWAAMLWVGFESVLRLVGAKVVGTALGSALLGSMLALLVGLPVVSWLIAKYGRMHGITSARWEYRRDAASIGWGSLAGLVILALMAGTAIIDAYLWGGTGEAATALSEGLRGSVLVAGLFLVTNGIVIPICEELAWRGVIQTAVVRAWGPAVGIVVVALAFAFKHVLIDASLSRITTLVMLSLVLGVVRHRWGTMSSTLAHAVTNSIATALVIASSW
jgi:membrane protease YdiL (CAAX protease family)